MNLVKVSLIIPVYNASLHLAQCIESVLTQTLKDIEVIIVNDGSADDSLAVIRKFEKQDKRVIVLDSTNEGVSVARNKGLTIATGEYIGFVDADDWAEPTMFELLYQKARISKADIAICNVNVIEAKKSGYPRLELEKTALDIEADRQSELVNLMRFKYDYANWNKIYLASLIREYKLVFSANLNTYEDLLFNLCFWQYSKKGVVLKNCLYNYRIHPSSIMNKGLFNSTEEFNKLCVEFASICNDYGWDDALYFFYKEMRSGFYFRHLRKLIVSVNQQKISRFKKIKLLVSQLEKMTPELFSYSKDEMKGLQSIKRCLLKRKKFYIFSIIGLFRGR